MRAIKNSGLMFPGDRKLTINLAPADTRKAGPAFDLPIAVGLLVATGQISEESAAGAVFIGELGLDGSVRSVSGVLPMALWARQAGRRKLIVPYANTREAAIVGEIDVYPVHTLADVIVLLAQGDDAPAPVREDPKQVLKQTAPGGMDFCDVKTSKVPLLYQRICISEDSSKITPSISPNKLRFNRDCVTRASSVCKVARTTLHVGETAIRRKAAGI